MLFLLYPSWLHPQIFPFLPGFLGAIRWYGLMYLIGFGLGYALLSHLIRSDRGIVDTRFTTALLQNYVIYAAIGVILGGRIFSTLVYDPTHFYWMHPWLIFWPFQGGHFVGLQGMSYHGGLLGGTLASLIFVRRYHLPMWNFFDAAALAVPLGYTFGRLGNFINGELYGKVTTMPWGMIFPHADLVPLSDPWGRAIAQKLSSVDPSALFANLPRHPSQLYEAICEGLVLFFVLWFFVLPRRKFDGVVACNYIIGYNTIRFFLEYFRQPDDDLRYILGHGAIYRTSLATLSMGQLLSICYIIVGFVLLYLARHSSKIKMER